MNSLTVSKRGQKYLSGSHPASSFFEKYFNNPYSKETNPDGLIIAGIAENKVLHNKIIQKLNEFKLTDTRDLCYNDPAGGEMFRKALLSVFQLFTKRKLDMRYIAASAGVTAVLVNLFMVICDLDDGVLVPTPCYGSFLSDIEDVPGCRFVQVKTNSQNQFIPTVDDLESVYKEEINNNRKLSALLLTNPDNPTGRLMSKENMISYIKWAKERSLHIVVDEIYALSSFGGEFTSSLDIIDEYFEGDDYFKHKFHVIHGLSKDFGMSGFRVGYLYSENEDVIKGFVKVNLSSMVSTFTQKAMQFLLEDKDWVSDYLKEMNVKLKETHEKTTSFLKEHDIPFIDSNAGIFITLDLRKYLKELSFNEEDRLFKHIAFNYNLFINAGKSFYFNEPGFFRMIFADIDEIDAILERLNAALQSFE